MSVPGHLERLQVGVSERNDWRAANPSDNIRSQRLRFVDAFRDELRGRNYMPVLSDFEKRSSRNMTETISTLAQGQVRHCRHN